MSEYFDDCEDKYPELIIEVIEYCNINNRGKRQSYASRKYFHIILTNRSGD